VSSFVHFLTYAVFREGTQARGGSPNVSVFLYVVQSNFISDGSSAYKFIVKRWLNGGKEREREREKERERFSVPCN
jgi:hypothetical protein